MCGDPSVSETQFSEGRIVALLNEPSKDFRAAPRVKNPRQQISTERRRGKAKQPDLGEEDPLTEVHQRRRYSNEG